MKFQEILRLKDLLGCIIFAKEGEIGHLGTFYFDDESWKIRYLTVDTGEWFSGKKVQISTAALAQPDWEPRKLSVALGKADIADNFVRENKFLSYENGPPLDHLGGGLFEEQNIGMTPDSIVETIRAKEQASQESVTEAPVNNSRLRDTTDLVGKSVSAQNGQIGIVEDIMIDGNDWAIRALVVAIKHTQSIKKVLISPALIDRVDWTGSRIYLNVSQETLINSPEYDPSTPFD